MIRSLIRCLPVAAAAGPDRDLRRFSASAWRVLGAQHRGLSRSGAADHRDHRADPGQSPEEVERYVTIPIEIAVASTPGLKYIRSNSVFALGFVRLQFEYGRDYHFVRQQALNRLKEADAAADGASR